MKMIKIWAVLLGMAPLFLLAQAKENLRPTESESTQNRKRSSSETYKDLIDKAQNLVLQKDRQQALSMLIAALDNEKAGSKGSKELKKSINDISQVFLSDKAQQLYELSLSLKQPDSLQAQARLNEALRIEGDNLTLLMEQARQLISKSDCKSANDIIARATKLNPISDELALLSAQTQVCNTGILILPKPTAPLSFPLEWATLDVDRAIREKNYTRAKEILLAIKKIEKNHPDINYWNWKIDLEQKINNPGSAQKYLVECKNLSSQLARRLNLDPWLCRRTAEVEAFLKAQPQN